MSTSDPPPSHPPTQPPASLRPPPRLQDDPAMRVLLPIGRSMLAIAAGYAGLFAIIVFPAPIALVLGIAAVVHLKRRPDLLGSDGIASRCRR